MGLGYIQDIDIIDKYPTAVKYNGTVLKTYPWI